MSSKLTTTVVVLVIAALIVAWWLAGKQSSNAPDAYHKQAQGTIEAKPSASPSPNNDVSDTGLDKDLSSIDSQISNLNADAADADIGLSDKPIPQAE